jgi:hypothetical protein
VHLPFDSVSFDANGDGAADNTTSSTLPATWRPVVRSASWPSVRRPARFRVMAVCDHRHFKLCGFPTNLVIAVSVTDTTTITANAVINVSKDDERVGRVSARVTPSH